MFQHAAVSGQTDDEFQGFCCLHRSDDADQRGEYAEQGACAVIGVFFGEKAGVARLVWQVGAVDGKLPVKPRRRARYQRLAGGNGGGVHGLAGGEIVAAIQNGIAARHKLCQYICIQPSVAFYAAA